MCIRDRLYCILIIKYCIPDVYKRQARQIQENNHALRTQTIIYTKSTKTKMYRRNRRRRERVDWDQIYRILKIDGEEMNRKMEEEKRWMKEESDQLRRKMEEGFATVSYTHLDVYKRQTYIMCLSILVHKLFNSYTKPLNILPTVKLLMRYKYTNHNNLKCL